MKLAEFYTYQSQEFDGVPWKLLGQALSIDYDSHHVLIELWGTDKATNTVFNLQMKASKYWVRPSQRRKEFPRSVIVPVAAWNEHFPEEEMSSAAVARFHQLKQLVVDMFGTVRWRYEDDPKLEKPEE